MTPHTPIEVSEARQIGLSRMECARRPERDTRGKWRAHQVGSILARNTFANCLTLPNTYWPGFECDLLVVTRKGQLIDVEIKLSKADLKADLGKEKWQNRAFKESREKCWPVRIWKHFICVPQDLWQEHWLEHVLPISGVLVVSDYGKCGSVRQIKQSQPNPAAYLCTPSDALMLGRLASLRMWDVLIGVARVRKGR